MGDNSEYVLVGTDLRGCVNPGIHRRYAVDNVLLVSGSGGTVYAIATDGCQLTVAEWSGQIEGRRLISVKGFRVNSRVDFRNDCWCCGDIRQQIPDGQFPNVILYVPDVHKDIRHLVLDIGILSNVAKGLGTKHLLLLVPPEGKEGLVDTAVFVVPVEGMDGFAVVPGCGIEEVFPGFALVMPRRDFSGDLDRISRFKSAYIEAGK